MTGVQTCALPILPFEVQGKGSGIVVGTPDNVAEWGPSKTGLSEAIVTTTSYASANPETVKKFVTATEQATAYISTHESKAVALAQSEIPGLTAPVLSKTNSLVTWLPSGQMNDGQWQTTVAFNEVEGSIASGSTVKENVDWTNKY